VLPPVKDKKDDADKKPEPSPDAFQPTIVIIDGNDIISNGNDPSVI
jgi:hypothetical protein